MVVMVSSCLGVAVETLAQAACELGWKEADPQPCQQGDHDRSADEFRCSELPAQ